MSECRLRKSELEDFRKWLHEEGFNYSLERSKFWNKGTEFVLKVKMSGRYYSVYDTRNPLFFYAHYQFMHILERFDKRHKNAEKIK